MRLAQSKPLLPKPKPKVTIPVVAHADDVRSSGDLAPKSKIDVSVPTIIARTEEELPLEVPALFKPSSVVPQSDATENLFFDDNDVGSCSSIGKCEFSFTAKTTADKPNLNCFTRTPVIAAKTTSAESELKPKHSGRFLMRPTTPTLSAADPLLSNTASQLQL